MLYAIAEIDNGESYRIFDACTESAFVLTASQAYFVIKHGIKIVNLQPIEHTVITKKWPRTVAKIERTPYGRYSDVLNLPGICPSATFNNSKYILLEKLSSKCRIVDHEGTVFYCTEDELIELIEYGFILNCEKVSQHKYESRYLIEGADKQFATEIAAEYNVFITKSRMLGQDIRFSYSISGKDVIYKQYIGNSNEAIVPNFITVIRRCAFGLCNVSHIVIGNNVKLIGEFAFAGNDTNNIDIPDSTVILEHVLRNKNNTIRTVNRLAHDSNTNITYNAKKTLKID